MEAWGAAVLAAVGAALATLSVASRGDPLVRVRMGDGAGGRRRASRVRRVARLVGSRSLVRRAASIEALAARVASAGWRVDVEEVAATKVVLALVLGFAGLWAPSPLWALAPVAAILGFRLPDLAVGRAERRRRARADAEIPQFLDAMSAASSAGLSAPLAVRRAAEVVRGPLAEELHMAIRSIDLGARWRDELRELADRLGLPDLRRTVGALTRTETLGSSLAEAVSELAEGVREARRAAAAERARTAPVKMLFPLVFLVLPAFLLLTVAPVLLATLRSIR